MRKFGSNNKLHTAGLCMKMACIALLSALWGCSEQENEMPATGTDEPMEVSLIINAKEVTGTRAPNDDIALIKSVRVYAFDETNEKVGYYYVSELKESGDTYYIPLRLSKGGQLSFYVIANEKCAPLYETESGTGQGKGAVVGQKVELTEATTLNDLYTYCFQTDETNPASCGYLMTGMTSQYITNQSTKPTVVECRLERDLSELNITFAKTGDFQATVTRVVLKDYTLLGWMFGDHPSWVRSFNKEGKEMLPTEHAVTTVVPEAEQRNPAKYTGTKFTRALSFNPSGYVFNENYDWTTPPETDEKPRLEIEYTQDGMKKTSVIYLPQIGRNIRFNVNCLIKATGIALDLRVKDWVENKSEIEWSDHYDFEFNPGKTAIEVGGENFYPICFTETSDPQGKDDFLVTFTLKGPLGTNWVASLDNRQDFYFADEKGTELKGAPKGTAPTTATEEAKSVTIRVRARTPFDENKPRQVKLAIRVQTAQKDWMRLIINPKHAAGNEEDVVLIKQVAK